MGLPRQFDVCARRIEAVGLTVRGGFHVRPEDGVPDTAGDGCSLILIGNAGSSFWPEFRQSTEYRDGRAHPLDRWSERVIGGLGRELSARPLFPFGGPPWHPFLRWARRAEPVTPSPLGMLIHPRYGLWHAWRGALVFNRRLEGLAEPTQAPSPCLSCVEQPCLHGCPVHAFDGQGFDVTACTDHLSGANDCTTQGCLARNACPAGKPFEYVQEQRRFHLAAFLGANRRQG